MTKKTCACQLVANTVVLYHTEIPPTHEDWGAYMELVKKAPKGYKMLTISKGGGPDALQRKQVGLLAASIGPPEACAVLSDSPIVRAIVTVMSWGGAVIKSYPLSALDDAVGHLGVPTLMAPLLSSVLDDLARQCGDLSWRVYPCA